MQRTTQESGQPRREERFAYDNAGRLLDDERGRIEDVTEREEEERDRELEERVEREFGEGKGK